MPSPISKMQGNFSPSGRIRVGYSEECQGNKGTYKKPKRSETFILTSKNRGALEAAANLFGGQVKPWPDARDPWRLFTEARELPVLIAPGTLSRNYELWEGGKCARRCDGITEQISGNPCMCPKDTADWMQAKKDNRGRGVCQFTMRCSVWIRGIPTGLGLWRFDTHSFYAGTEWPEMAGFLSDAAQRNVHVPVDLAIEREKGAGTEFNVVRIRMQFTMDELLAATERLGTAETPRMLTTAAMAHVPQLTAPAAAMIEAPRFSPSDDVIDGEFDEDTLDGRLATLRQMIGQMSNNDQANCIATIREDYGVPIARLTFEQAGDVIEVVKERSR